MARLQQLTAFLMLLVAGTCHGEHEARYFADKFVIQYAGMLGMISLGIENTTGEHSDYQLMAGYTPASAAGVDIYSVGFRTNYVFDPLIENEIGSTRIYTGIGLYYYFGHHYQTYEYPEGYYTHPASEWHLMPYLGMRLSGKDPAHQGVTLYAEAGIIDSYLIHYYNNHQTLRLGDAVSLALGVSIPLH